MRTQKVILGILAVIVVLVLGSAIISSINQTTLPVNSGNLPAVLCFYKEIPASRGLKDVTSIKMNIEGNSVSGEVRNLPAEKDSKVGTFTGNITGTNKVNENIADVFWNSLAEGMQVKEQLLIVFNSEHAKLGFGEMVDRGDGVYVYKDVNNLTYIDVPFADCASIVSPQIPVSPSVTPPQTPLNPAAPVQTGTGEFDKNVTLSLNQKITFPDGLKVTLKEINDSRCPAGVQCIWEGEISGNFGLSGGKLGNSADVRIGTVNNKSASLGGYTFSLKDASKTAIIITVSYEKPAPVSTGGCFVGGCSGEICSDQKDIASSCIFRPEFECYKTATCGKTIDGECGWINTPALAECLSKS